MTVEMTLDSMSDIYKIAIGFSYNEKLVEAIKKVPGREYIESRRKWVIPINQGRTAIEYLKKYSDIKTTPEVRPFLRENMLDVFIQSYGELFDVKMYPEIEQSVSYIFPETIDGKYEMKHLQWFVEFFDINKFNYKIDPILYKHLARITDEDVKNINNLKHELYWYQKIGVQFLVNSAWALLADDVGVGKTPQTLSACLYLKEKGRVKKTLLVVPASLKEQWADEIKMFTDTPTIIIGGTKKKRKKLYEDNSFFSIINYELLAMDKVEIQKAGFDIIVLDEIQRIKNRKTKTFQALEDIRTKYRFGLTATPIENNLEDLYNIISFINPRIYGTKKTFEDRYIIYDINEIYINRQKRKFRVIAGYKNLDEVKEKLKDVMIRRLRTEVLPDLPPVVEKNYYVDLSKTQRDVYKSVEMELIHYLNKTDASLNNILAKITYLRQIADSAELVSDEVGSSKIDELKKILSDIGNRNVVIFTQFKRMGDIINRELEKDHKVCFIHGDVPTSTRNDLKKEFNAGKYNVMVTTDCFQYGANLQSADTLINFDLPWTDSKLTQRIGRIQRHGQKAEKVYIINMITRGTIEERVVKLIMEKRGLANNVLIDADFFAGKMSIKSLKELYKMEE